MPAKSEERTTLQDGPRLQVSVSTGAPDDGSSDATAEIARSPGGLEHIAPGARRRSRHASTGLALMAYDAHHKGTKTQRTHKDAIQG